MNYQKGTARRIEKVVNEEENINNEIIVDV